MASAAHSLPIESPATSISRGLDGAPRRVLYAEDQVSSRIVTKAMLEKMGFLVDAVDDGEVAVERARQSRYDLILLDIEMPVMDGVTAARLMRTEIAACRNTPILALSAFLADSTEACHWRDAFDNAVPKPASALELKRAMASALKGLHMDAVAQAELNGAAIEPPVDLVSPNGLWRAMRAKLHPGALRILVETATGEMHHVTLALAAARESSDAEAVRRFRHTLKGLALNFGLEDLVEMISSTSTDQRAMNVSAVFGLIAEWQSANTAH